MVGSVFLMASYFLLCMRLRHFQEWEWDADVQEVYSVISCLNQTHGLHEIASNWRYQSALTYYILASGHSPFPEVTGPPDGPYSPSAEMYVLSGDWEQAVLKDLDLRVIYRGSSSDVVIAVHPEIAPKLETSPCVVHVGR